MSSLSRSSLTLRIAQICPPGLSSTQYSLPQKTARIHLSGSHPASTTISLNCAILTPSGHCPNFLPSKHCAQKFRSQARATLCAISVINLAPCLLELSNVQLLGLLSHPVINLGPSSWITVHHLILGSFQIDVVPS